MRRTDQDRLPPHSGDAERGVLGCILLDPQTGVGSAADSLLGFETPFYDPRHHTIFSCIRDLLDRGVKVDLVTLTSALETSGDLERIGGFAYLSTLMDSVVSAANIGEYLKIVRDKAMLRKAIATCQRGIHAAYATEGEPDSVIHDLEAQILSIRHHIPGNKARHTREIASEVLTILEDRISRKRGLATGFYDLDKFTNGGIQPGEMWVIAGRPSMGKTSLGMDIARNVATDYLAHGVGKSVVVFSLEMTAEALTERLVSGISRVNTRIDRLPQPEDMERIAWSIDEVSKLPLVIDDTSSIPISVIKSRARSYFQRFDVGLFVLDYLQLVPSDSGMNDRRVAVDQISAGVKGLAKELGAPWIALCQLNRLLEREKERKPRLSDLRESGSIEQDADFVGMLYAPDEGDEEKAKAPVREVHLTIAKQRNGPRYVDVPLLFHGPYTRFESATIKEEAIPT